MLTKEALRRLLGGFSSPDLPILPTSASAPPVAAPPAAPAPRAFEGTRNLMAKLAEVVKPATPQKIATAKRLIEAGEQEIAALRTALSAALLSEDDSEAIKITEKIAAIEKRIALNQQKLAALGKQGRKERTADREQRKTEALAAFEKSLSETAGIAAKIDKAVDDLAAALKEYRAAKRKPFDKWPADLFPSLKI